MNEYAQVVRPCDDEPVDLAQPPQGVWCKREPQGFELGCSGRSRAAAVFLITFLLILCVGTICLYQGPITKGELNLFHIVFGLLALAIMMTVAGAAAMSMWGKFYVRTKEGRGEVFIGVGTVGYRRKFRWNQVKDIRIEIEPFEGSVHRTLIIDAEKPIKVPDFGDEEMRFVLAALRQLSPLLVNLRDAVRHEGGR